MLNQPGEFPIADHNKKPSTNPPQTGVVVNDFTRWRLFAAWQQTALEHPELNNFNSDIDEVAQAALESDHPTSAQ